MDILGDRGTVLAALIGLALLTALFLVLWLRARGGGGGPGDELRAARHELKVLKGDLIQAGHDRAAEVARLNRELDNLRAVAGGGVPPELEEWRRRAQAAEARIASERAEVEAQHRARIEELERDLDESLGRTVVMPGIHAIQEQLKTLGQELVEARRQLAVAEERHQGELKELGERLGAEKAAALTALAGRAGQGTGAVAPEEAVDGTAYPFLEVIEGDAVGARHYLPFGEATIGRESPNTIIVKESGASRHHAKIAYDGVDFVLSDLKSANGTFVNDLENAIDSARLGWGDVVAIGNLRFRFTCAAETLAASDPGRAVEAFRAMLKVAPNCRAALHGLASLLERDEARRDEAARLRERLATLDTAA